MKLDFRTEWKDELLGIVAVILWNVFEYWLIDYYAFSRLKSFLISGAVVVSAMVILIHIKDSLRSKRDQSKD